MPIRILFTLLLLASASSLMAAPKMEFTDTIVSYKIWDEAPHSAFTDLIKFNNRYYCTFREGKQHVGGKGGTARVLVSDDGANWKSLASLSIENKDIRDPKMSITPQKELLIFMDVEESEEGKVISRKPYTSYLNKAGTGLTTPQPATVDRAVASWSDWLWRLTWHKKKGYTINYQMEGGLHLMQTKDAKSFQQISSINVGGYPNESTIRFDKQNKMYVLIRRDKDKPIPKGILATAIPPYTNWQLDTLQERIGGPDFLFLNNSTIAIGTRLYGDKEWKDDRTGILVTDLNGNTKKKIYLPSGGDTSYPGMLIEGEELWMSYYSSHEGKTAIYFARIPLKLLH